MLNTEKSFTAVEVQLLSQKNLHRILNDIGTLWGGGSRMNA